MDTYETLKNNAHLAYKAYQEEQKKVDDFEYNSKKDMYQDQFRCMYCRYNCLTEVAGWDNLCMQGTWADGPCKKFEPHNELSAYIELENHPSFEIWDKIANLLVDDEVKCLLDDEMLADKAIAIYEIVQDKGENK